jgi:hypothetical protein
MDNLPAPLPGARVLKAIGYLLLTTLVLGSLAYWLPWIDHRTAALKLSGQDLGEFVKFVPALQGRPLGTLRQVLYVPPLITASCLVLLAANRGIPYPRPLRAGMLALALFVLSGLLPPVWGQPRDLLTPQYLLQGIAVLFSASLVLAHGVLRQVRLVSLAWVTAALSVVALLPIQCVFWAARPAIWATYGSPTIHLGWGLVLHIMSWMGALALAIVLLCWIRTQPRRTR